MLLNERSHADGTIEVTLIELRGVLPFDSVGKPELTEMGIRANTATIENMAHISENGVTLYDAEKLFVNKPYRHHIFFGWQQGDKVKVTHYIDDKKIMITFKCRML